MPPADGTPLPTPGSARSSAVARDVAGLKRVRDYRLLIALAVIVLGLDQLTKAWISSRLPFPTYGEPHSIRLIRGFLYFVHVGNTGAAWSLFAGQSIFLALLAAGTLVAIFIWRHALGLRDRPSQLAFGLLCGGIAGNLLDRLLHGHVIDFIDVHFGSYIYPTFNVADSAICVGVIFYLWQSLRSKD
ncbi:MAG: signal peptidase II [Opitutus sp.]